MRRRTQRLPVLLLSCMLLTLSCHIAPVGGGAGELVALGLLDGGLSPEAQRSETAFIARRLRARASGPLPLKVDELARLIVREADAAGLRPSLVMAVIEVESSVRNFSTSPVGARGLMQLLPTTGESVATAMGAVWAGPESLFDPVLNVQFGVRYLRDLIDRYGDLHTALAAYNWGPGRIADRVRRGEPIPHRYVERVLASYHAAIREI